MHYLILVAMFCVLIVLLIFSVIFSMKALSLLDGIAKKAEIEGYSVIDFDFGSLIQKPNRSRQEGSIRKKFKERRMKFDRRERRE